MVVRTGLIVQASVCFVRVGVVSGSVFVLSVPAVSVVSTNFGGIVCLRCTVCLLVVVVGSVKSGVDFGFSESIPFQWEKAIGGFVWFVCRSVGVCRWCSVTSVVDSSV